jgi:CNT family concentrative nucleoside transporter
MQQPRDQTPGLMRSFLQRQALFGYIHGRSMNSKAPIGDRFVEFLRRHRLRLVLLAVCALAGLLAFGLRNAVGPRFVALFGIIVFLSLIMALSRNPSKIEWRTVAAGLFLQVALALFVIKTEWGRELFLFLGAVVGKFLAFSDEGARFVFGVFVDEKTVEGVFGEGRGFVFAFRALPTIIFVSSFFTVMYYLGVLQAIVRAMARLMVKLMRTSGSESLSSAANVFMGQTEAPLIIRPYLSTLTRSELVAVMTGGFATISGAIMAVYIQLGADATALLTTSVMAAPCSLMLAKILYPEEEASMTRGVVKLEVGREDSNLIDAAVRGASDGTKLAINVAAMLIAFLALIALVDYLLAVVSWGDPSGTWFSIGGLHVGSPGAAAGADHLSLRRLFGWIFSPVSFLMGVRQGDVMDVASLLGTKLVANEFVAYLDLTGTAAPGLAHSSRIIATFALCGFANFSSVGIQIGGIAALVPERRHDLAVVGMRALLAGFMATVINATIAGVILG